MHADSFLLLTSSSLPGFTRVIERNFSVNLRDKEFLSMEGRHISFSGQCSENTGSFRSDVGLSLRRKLRDFFAVAIFPSSCLVSDFLVSPPQRCDTGVFQASS